MQDFEKVGSFYLGKVYDMDKKERTENLLLYDSKDLTTHAVCVGMTGSGKTGLCISLLEEAAMDQIPALVIDPKGDMSNLLLSFPDLAPEDFAPWVQAADAERKGQTIDEYAASTAAKWREGLADWGQDGERIRTMREKVEFTIYTPGSSAGRPLSILKLVDLPSEAVLQDSETLAQYTSSTVSSLLALLGIEADPLTSREHILLSNILLNAWQSGRSLDLAGLIRAIQQPDLETVGVMPLDTFYPSGERFKLAMQFNNLLASPQFAAWTQGEPLDIQSLLYTESGKPRISILSINHLNDSERMFFVASFLNQVLSWVRAQSGTSSLRAILYMDEIYGFFPPVANPPSKQPLLTLLKQARAFGLGVVLTTQNPVDLDYKGLANIGTWFVGRLQTDQDKARLLDGLQGASAEASAKFDRKYLDQLLSNLSSRVFLLNNVHEDAPEIFETRWAMSYLAGPLTRNQIMKLQPREAAPPTVPAAEPVAPPVTEPVAQADAVPVAAGSPEVPVNQASAEQSAGSAGSAVAPQLPPDVKQFFLEPRSRSGNIVYKPTLYAYVSSAFNDTAKKISEISEEIFSTPVAEGALAVDWNTETSAKPEPDELVSAAPAGARFAKVPTAAMKKSSYTAWEKDLKDYAYRTQTLSLLRNPVSGIVSKPGESERDFVARVHQENRETRDQKVQDLREKYAKRIKTLEEKIRKAEQKVDAEEKQASTAKMSTVLDVGSTILGALFSKNKLSRTNVNKAATAAKSAGRASQQGSDVDRAKASLETYQADLEELQQEMQTELDALAASYDAANEKLETIELRPKKTDINVKIFALLWLPYDGADLAY